MLIELVHEKLLGKGQFTSVADPLLRCRFDEHFKGGLHFVLRQQVRLDQPLVRVGQVLGLNFRFLRLQKRRAQDDIVQPECVRDRGLRCFIFV